jgi:hypothetical protein
VSRWHVKNIAILLMLGICFSVMSDEQLADHVLSGTTKSGKHWEIFINCHFSEGGIEIVKGELKIEGASIGKAKKGQIVETTLANIKYFGIGKEANETVEGWYFELWPKTCSYLPK